LQLQLKSGEVGGLMIDEFMMKERRISSDGRKKILCCWLWEVLRWRPDVCIVL